MGAAPGEGGGFRLRGRGLHREGGGARPRCSPAPASAPETPGKEGGEVPSAPFVPYLATGDRKGAGPAWALAKAAFCLGHQAVGSRDSGEGGGRGWRSRPSAALGLSLARALPSVRRVPIPGACSLTVGPPALVSTSVRGGDGTPQRVMGGPRGHWLVAESLALDSTRVRGRCRRTHAGEGGQRREAAVVEARVPG